MPSARIASAETQAPGEWNHEAFEDFVHKHLVSNGITAKEFAAKVPMSPGALADILNRQSTGQPRRTPSTPLIKKLADALEISVWSLAPPRRAQKKAS